MSPWSRPAILRQHDLRRVLGAQVGYSTRIIMIATTPPSSCTKTKAGTEAGAMPAKVSENMRPTSIAKQRLRFGAEWGWRGRVHIDMPAEPPFHS